MAKGTGMAPAKSFREMNVADPLRDMQRQFRNLFGETFNLWPEGEESMSMRTWSPVCDIYETENEIIVKAELPEVKQENVKVCLEDNILSLRGERRFEEETNRENYHRVERSYGEFMRNFRVPNSVDAANINAEFRDGVLKITMPKRPESIPKTIEVKVN